jgi:Holliday junction resolvase RusA-like endonuclease
MTAMSSPNDFVLDLPYPPSVNRIWRASKLAGKNVHLAPSYKAWRDEAGAVLMTKRGWMMHRITGLFSLDLALCPPKGHPRGDLDNRIKAILDFLQRTTIVSNDKHCQLICAYWVERSMAPQGARVIVKPWKVQSMADVLHSTQTRLEGQRA